VNGLDWLWVGLGSWLLFNVAFVFVWAALHNVDRRDNH